MNAVYIACGSIIGTCDNFLSSVTHWVTCFLSYSSLAAVVPRNVPRRVSPSALMLMSLSVLEYFLDSFECSGFMVYTDLVALD